MQTQYGAKNTVHPHAVKHHRRGTREVTCLEQKLNQLLSSVSHDLHDSNELQDAREGLPYGDEARSSSDNVHFQRAQNMLSWAGNPNASISLVVQRYIRILKR